MGKKKKKRKGKGERNQFGTHCTKSILKTLIKMVQVQFPTLQFACSISNFVCYDYSWLLVEFTTGIKISRLGLKIIVRLQIGFRSKHKISSDKL